MTEEEWLTATNPQPMLEFLQGKTTDRKLRLFGLACCRRLWHLLVDKRSRNLVEVAEQVANGWMNDEEWQRAKNAATDAYWAVHTAEKPALLAGAPEFPSVGAAAFAIEAAGIDDALVVAKYAAGRSSRAVAGRFRSDEVGSPAAIEYCCQASLVRDIFRNPFRPATFDSTWRTPNVTDLAAAIYEERQLPSGLFDKQRLGVLADALEDAGCDKREVLKHCRNGDEHVRGCWAIDQLLGKE